MKHFCLVRTKHFLDDFGILEEMSKTLLFCFSLGELVKVCPVARITEIFEKKIVKNLKTALLLFCVPTIFTYSLIST